MLKHGLGRYRSGYLVGQTFIRIRAPNPTTTNPAIRPPTHTRARIPHIPTITVAYVAGVQPLIACVFAVGRSRDQPGRERDEHDQLQPERRRLFPLGKSRVDHELLALGPGRRVVLPLRVDHKLQPVGPKRGRIFSLRVDYELQSKRGDEWDVPELLSSDDGHFTKLLAAWHGG